ncbi:4Fe-4S binding protein [Chloroflexota bacterium]
MPEINQEYCAGCGLCVSVCSCGALVLVDNVVIVVETKDCHWCVQCEVVCPNDALTCPFEIVIEES